MQRNQSGEKSQQSIGSRSFKRTLISAKERDYVIENLSMLVAAGMGIGEALSGIQKELRTPGMRAAVAQIKKDVEGGAPLWRAVQTVELYSAHTTALIRIGEEAGRLSQNLQAIAVQHAKDRAFKSKLRSAVMYPVFVLALTLVVGLTVAWFVLPRLSTVFSALDADLPLITRAFINLGTFLDTYGAIAVPLFVVALVGTIYALSATPRSRQVGQQIIFALPGVKRLIQEIELARLGFLFGSMLEAGLPLTDALDSLSRATSSYNYTRLYSFLRTSILEGNSFAKSFARFPHIGRLIPVPVQQMIIAGEQSGRLPVTLIKIGEIYEAKTDISAKDLTIILEPLLLVIVAVGVLAVAVAMVLPLYSLLGQFN